MEGYVYKNTVIVMFQMHFFYNIIFIIHKLIPVYTNKAGHTLLKYKEFIGTIQCFIQCLLIATTAEEPFFIFSYLLL